MESWHTEEVSDEEWERTMVPFLKHCRYTDEEISKMEHTMLVIDSTNKEIPEKVSIPSVWCEPSDFDDYPPPKIEQYSVNFNSALYDKTFFLRKKV